MSMLADYLQNPVIMFGIIVWDLVWRGLALWSSARKGRKYWFVPLLIVNSVGLLPIIYLLVDKYWRKSSQKQ